MKTTGGLPMPPDAPQFGWDRLPSDNGLANIKVTWHPNTDDNNAGSHFFVQYMVKGESQWLSTAPEMNENWLIVRGLQPDTNYEFRVVSVDGEFTQPSGPQDVDTYGIGEFMGEKTGL